MVVVPPGLKEVGLATMLTVGAAGVDLSAVPPHPARNISATRKQLTAKEILAKEKR